MSTPIKQLLPEQWWRIAACVDAYEAASDEGSTDLRNFVGELPHDERPAALAELIKVDVERRQLRGDARTLESYLADYPEVRPELLATSEALPASDDAEASAMPEQAHVGTVPFGVAPAPTERFKGQGSGTLPTNFGSRAAELQSDTSPATETSALDRAAPAAGGAGAGATVIGHGEAVAPEDDPSRAAHTLEVDTAATARSRSAQPVANATKASLGSSRMLSETGVPGGTIGRYRILGTLGAGTFGVVYQCRDEDLKRDVAIKVPRAGRAHASQQTKQFSHEAQSAARLRHPGIVTVLDKGATDDGRTYIVYEFVAGASLQARMQRGGYTHREAALWSAEIAEALHHAHQHGIVHRDIKPANVLLDERGKVKVADFGLAKMDDAFFIDDQGRVLGTVAYMSPEQAAGKSEWSSPQSDIYAVGVVLYELLCRKLPFSKGSTDDILKQVIARPPAPPRTVDDTIPAELERICLKAMAKDPSARYTTSGDMAAELRAAIAPTAPPKIPPRNLYIWGAAGGGALALAALLFFVLRPREQTSLPPATIAKIDRVLQAQLDAVAKDPVVQIDLQRADQGGSHKLLDTDDLPLHEGDKLQIHVALPQPQFVYAYWYDSSGTTVRLWPRDVAAQNPVAKVDIPQGDNEWQTLDAARGYEMLILAVRDEELTDQELQEFERRPAFAASHDLAFKNITVVGSDVAVRSSRGLSAVVTSKKNPLDRDFEQSLQERFDAYYGLAFPHQ